MSRPHRLPDLARPPQTPRALVASTLATLFDQEGPTLLTEPARLATELRSGADDAPREIALILAALDEDVPQGLLATHDRDELPELKIEMAQRLVARRSLDPNAAAWAVQSWALALDLPPDAAASLAPVAARTAQATAALVEPSFDDPPTDPRMRHAAESATGPRAGPIGDTLFEPTVPMAFPPDDGAADLGLFRRTDDVRRRPSVVVPPVMTAFDAEPRISMRRAPAEDAWEPNTNDRRIEAQAEAPRVDEALALPSAPATALADEVSPSAVPLFARVEDRVLPPHDRASAAARCWEERPRHRGVLFALVVVLVLLVAAVGSVWRFRPDLLVALDIPGLPRDLRPADSEAIRPTPAPTASPVPQVASLETGGPAPTPSADPAAANPSTANDTVEGAAPAEPDAATAPVAVASEHVEAPAPAAAVDPGAPPSTGVASDSAPVDRSSRPTLTASASAAPVPRARASNPPRIAGVDAARVVAGKPFFVPLHVEGDVARLAAVERRIVDSDTTWPATLSVTRTTDLARSRDGALLYAFAPIDRASASTVQFTPIDRDGRRGVATNATIRVIGSDDVRSDALGITAAARMPAKSGDYCALAYCGRVLEVRERDAPSSGATYDVTVRMDDRTTVTVNNNGTPLPIGARVQLRGSELVRVGER